MGSRNVPALAVLLTSEAGARCDSREHIRFTRTGPERPPSISTVVSVFPDDTKQTIEGIGSSFTEASAFVLAHLEPDARREVMDRAFGRSGANLTLVRTHVGSCDFTVHGKYCYRSSAQAPFSVACDLDGFDPERHPGVRDRAYDLLPMIREANGIKVAQGDPPLKILASPWTAPPWMKDTGDWFTPASAANGRKGRGGSLLPGRGASYARYLLAYLDAYRREGVGIWGMTPVNEPEGNGGHWESMEWPPAAQASFIAKHLGPLLAASDHEVRLLGFDQNRDHMEAWADALFGDEEASRYLYGLAVHWYSSTVRVYEEGFDRIRARYPDKAIIHSEGCIDCLGCEAPPGVADPDGYRESGWFGNDAFWWGANATDWAYTATWEGVDAAEHPKYAPVHRYCRDVLVGIDHGLSGWIDWNLVLDRGGGPNHVGNLCGAPIMIDTRTGGIHYTPVFHVLAQLSRTIRPGDVALRTERTDDALWSCATLGRHGEDRVASVQLFNPSPAPVPLTLRIGKLSADVEVPANALLTVQVKI